MKFQATEEQVLQIAANAVNASAPMGLGYMHYQADNVFKPEDLKDYLDRLGLYLDYVQGRMVKLYIKPLTEEEENTWEINDNPRSDYQSWVFTYPTTEALVNSVLKPEVEDVQA